MSKFMINLLICLNEARASFKPTARPLSSVLIRSISWHLCDGIKLWVVGGEDTSIHMAKNSLYCASRG